MRPVWDPTNGSLSSCARLRNVTPGLHRCTCCPCTSWSVAHVHLFCFRCRPSCPFPPPDSGGFPWLCRTPGGAVCGVLVEHGFSDHPSQRHGLDYVVELCFGDGVVWPRGVNAGASSPTVRGGAVRDPGFREQQPRFAPSLNVAAIARLEAGFVAAESFSLGAARMWLAGLTARRVPWRLCVSR